MGKLITVGIILTGAYLHSSNNLVAELGVKNLICPLSSNPVFVYSNLPKIRFLIICQFAILGNPTIRSTFFEVFSKFNQGRFRIKQMLQHIVAHNNIKEIAGPRQVNFLDIPDHHIIQKVFCLSIYCFRDFNTVNKIPPLF